jgi:hypothetical protein
MYSYFYFLFQMLEMVPKYELLILKEKSDCEINEKLNIIVNLESTVQALKEDSALNSKNLSHLEQLNFEYKSLIYRSYSKISDLSNLKSCGNF